MQALKTLDADIAERVRIAGRSFLQLTPAQRKERFAEQLARHGINFDALSSSKQRLHYLAQQAVIGFEAVVSVASHFEIFDAVLTVLCDAHGGAHGTELSRSSDFNAILRIYYP